MTCCKEAQIQNQCGDRRENQQVHAEWGPNPSRETKLSGANGDRGVYIYPVQLTTSRVDNVTRLILTLAICDDHTAVQLPRKRKKQYNSNLDLQVEYNKVVCSDRVCVRSLYTGQIRDGSHTRQHSPPHREEIKSLVLARFTR